MCGGGACGSARGGGTELLPHGSTLERERPPRAGGPGPGTVRGPPPRVLSVHALHGAERGGRGGKKLIAEAPTSAGCLVPNCLEASAALPAP